MSAGHQALSAVPQVSTRLVQAAKNVDLVLVNGKFVDGRGVIGSALTIQNGRIVNVGICGEEPLIPLLVRRGVCGIKKISAKPTLAPQTGWSLMSQVSV